MTQNELLLSEKIRAMHARMAHLCLDKQKGLDTMRMIQIYAGMICELCLEYDSPGEMMCVVMEEILVGLNSPLHVAVVCPDAMPPIYILDREIEFGRAFIREVTLDDWDDVHDTLKVLANLIVHDFSSWEEKRLCRRENIRLLYECVRLALAFEMGAQDLCDVIIEEKIAQDQWSLADCVAGMSGLVGYQIGSCQDPHRKKLGKDHISTLDQAIFIMTQEASRLGVSNSSDWRSNIAANDQPAHPPIHLIRDIEPLCIDFSNIIEIFNPLHRAAMLSKATGRMIAVAAGGDFPEIEPAIAKPLAMMAVTESYRYLEFKKIGAV